MLVLMSIDKHLRSCNNSIFLPGKVINKMKTGRLIIFSVLITLFLLAGCSNQRCEEISFFATVLENNQSNLLVEPAEGSAELSSADRIVVYLEDAMITDAQGNKVDVIAIEIGSQVKIIYDGIIAESYPAQIRSYRVQIVE